MRTAPKEFENGVFTLKTRQMFFVHTMAEKFGTEQSLVDLDLRLLKT